VYGWDFYGQKAKPETNAITWTDCVARGNAKSGIGATYVPMPMKVLSIRGGSYEANCLSDPTCPQVQFRNAWGVVIDGVYFECGAVVPWPVALEIGGLRGAEISNCFFNGATYGIRAAKADTTEDVSTHNNFFVSITADHINVPAGRRVVQWGNGAGPIVVCGPDSGILTATGPVA